MGFAKGIIAYFVFYVVPCSSQVFEKEKILFCSHLRVGMQRLIIFFSIASIAIVLRAVVSSASSCILRYLQRQIMASWKNWSTWATWDYTSHPNDDSATHNWNDWDWKSSRWSEEDRSTGWDGWNEEWQAWTSNDRWEKDQEQWDWKNDDPDWEEVEVESPPPKPTAAKTRVTPSKSARKPPAKAKAGRPAKAKPLQPKPPQTVPPPHLFGMARPPPPVQNSGPSMKSPQKVKPPVKPARLLVVPVKNEHAPLALHQPTEDQPTSMSPKRKSESAELDGLAKGQKIEHTKEEEASGSAGLPEVASYSTLAAQCTASPKSKFGWKAPTPPPAGEECFAGNAEVLATHAASLALAAGGVFIPGRFLNIPP